MHEDGKKYAIDVQFRFKRYKTFIRERTTSLACSNYALFPFSPAKASQNHEEQSVRKLELSRNGMKVEIYPHGDTRRLRYLVYNKCSRDAELLRPPKQPLLSALLVLTLLLTHNKVHAHK